MFDTGRPDDLIQVGIVSTSDDGLGDKKQVLVTAVAS